jgi:hypothetical protein
MGTRSAPPWLLLCPHCRAPPSRRVVDHVGQQGNDAYVRHGLTGEVSHIAHAVSMGRRECQRLRGLPVHGAEMGTAWGGSLSHLGVPRTHIAGRDGASRRAMREAGFVILDWYFFLDKLSFSS